MSWKPVIPVALAFTENIANLVASSADAANQTARHFVDRDAVETI